MECTVWLFIVILAAWLVVCNVESAHPVSSQYKPPPPASGPPCPQGCVCSTDGWQLTVRCVDQQLTTLPHGIPHDVDVLVLHDNQFTAIPVEQLNSTGNLRQIDMSNNKVVGYCGTNVSMSQQNSSQTVSIHYCAELSLPAQIDELSLRNNSLQCLDLQCFVETSIFSLDVSFNNISSIVPPNPLLQFSHLRELNISHNDLHHLQYFIFEFMADLTTLDISHNQLTDLWVSEDGADVHMSGAQRFSRQNTSSRSSVIPTENLQYLDISANQLSYIEPDWFLNMLSLRDLLLSDNRLVFIPAKVFMYCTSLQYLHLSHMSTLKYIDQDAFAGLTNLHTLELSDNKDLAYINSAVMRPLTNLRKLDLSNNGLHTLFFELFIPLKSLELVLLQNNIWNCDCGMHWLLELTKEYPIISYPYSHVHNVSVDSIDLEHLQQLMSAKDFICALPINFTGMLLSETRNGNWSCTEVTIVSDVQRTQFHIGSPAVLNCEVSGDPQPHISWKTPRGKLVVQDPAYVSLHHSASIDGTLQLDAKQPHMHVLANGSLYIASVFRNDVGRYTCTAFNPNGNITLVVPLRLDAIFRHKVNISFAVGLCSAICFLFIGIIVAILRYVAFKCSPEQRAKRRSIRQILRGLSEYRSEKYDRFSAFREAKFDQLSAFKSAKVSKLKNAKNLTVTTLFNYLHQTQENYTLQIQHLREHCIQQATNLRENYGSQLGKIRGYRSEKIEKIREHYQGQANRIKDYGATQLEKLRDQYHLQQQHALKILEIMNIGNCMSVIESECMRTDSLIFDEELFDLDNVYKQKCPVQMLSTSDSHSNVSNYQTAGSDNEANITVKPEDGNGAEDEALQNSKSILEHPGRKRARHQQKNTNDYDEQESPLSPPRKPHYFRRKKKQNKKKQLANEEIASTALARDDSIHYMGDTEDTQQPQMHDPHIHNTQHQEQSIAEQADIQYTDTPQSSDTTPQGYPHITESYV